jgi:nitronate monooxygenase
MFMVSTPDLVVECCRAGVVGCFPSLNQRDNAGYAGWLDAIEWRLAESEQADGRAAAPFGVNLSMRRRDPRLEEDIATTVRRRIPLVITSLGVFPEVIARVHEYGGTVFHDVTTLRHAEKAAAAGVDGLIAVCAGAGGHGGQLNPFAFLGELRGWFRGVVVLGGAISTGRQVAAARLMGADLVSMGTRFIATRESGAPDDYKQMVVAAGSQDIIHTARMTGVGANFLVPSLRDWGIDPDHLDGAAVDSATRTVRHGAREGKVWRDIWSAGQGVGSISSVPGVAELCRQLAADYRAAGGA